mmetsp:Transcript_98752/g.283737  ORF Transcript_98752/g.283737 Transcript_98752/m.283737 type:complete len:182 (+) Transcript_98752:76-621(+)
MPKKDEESEEEEEEEDDERIMTMMMFWEKHSPKETADKMRELGGDDALIYNELFNKPRHAMAHFMLMGIGNFDDGRPLAPQLEEKRKFFKEWVQDGEDGGALLLMLELFCMKECRPALEAFSPVLKVLWERDIVAEEQILAWHENERSLMEFWPKFFSQKDAETIRRSSKEFVRWVQEGEG